VIHEPLPLPPPPDETEFDTSDVTRERARDRQIDELHARISELEQGWESQVRAMRIEVREAAYEAKCARETSDLILAEVRKLTKFMLEERGERFVLADRVSRVEQTEQPRPARRKK
jgi:hypothetical protein